MRRGNNIHVQQHKTSRTNSDKTPPPHPPTPPPHPKKKKKKKPTLNAFLTCIRSERGKLAGKKVWPHLPDHGLELYAA